MDFLDPKKKRAHKIRLYIGYFLMAIALAIGTLILLFEANGYDVDRRTGEVIQNGLIFVGAHPEQAQVYVNGKREGDTGMRLTLPGGPYDIRLHRDGYRDWQRSFTLAGSAIERLDYAFLFPEKLEPKSVRPYAKAPSFATQSPDRKWAVIQQPGKLGTFDVINLGESDNPTISITPPASLFTAASSGKHTLKPVEWSTDNRHMLVKHTYRGGFEFIMIDREQPEESININKTFDMRLSQVALRDKKFDKLHLLEAKTNTLRFGDSKSKQVSTVAGHVLAFKSYGDDVVLYVTSEHAPAKKVIVNVRRDTQTYKLRELSQSKRYVVDITRYGDRTHQRWFMAVGANDENRVYVYRDAFDTIASDNPSLPPPIAALRVPKPQYLSVSANTQFIGVQGGSKFAVYDAEHDREYSYDTQLKLAAGQEATWMDGHRYAIVSQGKLVVFDYDGVNKHTLTTVYPAFLPFFDRDYDNLYTLGPAGKGRATFSVSPMRISTDHKGL